jgi:hypothetical protein
MAYFIKKLQSIQGNQQIIYYQGDKRWSTNFDDRKLYSLKSEATTELYGFGGSVVKNEGYNPNATDRDGDGIVQEGTEFERPIDT